MPIDFHLSPSESGIRAAASGFAQHVLKPSRDVYLQHADHPSRFQATQPTYAAAVQGGLLKGQLSPALGGTAGSLNTSDASGVPSPLRNGARNSA